MLSRRRSIEKGHRQHRVAVSSCAPAEREQRSFEQKAPPEQPVALSVLAPGGEPPETCRRATRPRSTRTTPIRWSEGKKLFSAFQLHRLPCQWRRRVGPALIDDHWIYGSAIENIAATIREGRPNGMPSFRDKIPEEQIWELGSLRPVARGADSQGCRLRPGRTTCRRRRAETGIDSRPVRT
jgi:cytochrome c oxidase cbb3-type subunit 3